MTTEQGKKSRAEKQKRRGLSDKIRLLQNAGKIARADGQATGMEVTKRDGKMALAHGSWSGFNNPAVEIAKRIQAALDPNQVFSSPGVVVEQKEVADPEWKGGKVTVPYRVVVQRTEKALRISCGTGRPVWFPKACVKFLPGNLMEIPYSYGLKLYRFTRDGNSRNPIPALKKKR